MLSFAVGTACVVAPGVGLPLAVALGAFTSVRSLKNGGLRVKRTGSEAKIQHGFEKFDGPREQVSLEFGDLQCVLETKDGQKKRILKGVSGLAKPGRLLALMGPSGSGKTTLLNTLAGQVPLNSKMELEGEVTVNGVPATNANHKQAYVQQEDIFYSQLTVWETLSMAAELRLPASMTPQARTAYVERLLAVLGLAKVRDTVVGDAKTRGLSGGEKKRLSIGCELIGSPSLLFLDEPTTGLDAFQAEKVMSTLKTLADVGHTVVCSIHQPRSSIFAMFDDLLLLCEGEVVYAGAADKVLDHFAALGHTCPEHYNPAEFVADLISLDFISAESEAATRARVKALVDAWKAKQTSQPPVLVHKSVSGDLRLARANITPHAGPLKQLRLLIKRSWQQVTRDRGTAIARAMSNISSALIFGSIFFRIKRSQSSIQDRLGLLQVAAINTAMSSLVKTLNVFPRERMIVNRERAQHSYGTLPYLTAKLVAELPIGAVFPLLFGSLVYPLTGLNPSLPRFAKFLSILTLESFTAQALGLAVGSFAPSTEAALAIGPAVMVVWIVFGGYYVNAENVPTLLKWLPQASFIKSAFEALCINEFSGASFEADASGGGMRTGEKVLEWLSFDKASVKGRLLSQGRILMFYYWTTYSILRANKPRFLPIRQHKMQDNDDESNITNSTAAKSDGQQQQGTASQ